MKKGEPVFCKKPFYYKKEIIFEKDAIYKIVNIGTHKNTIDIGGHPNMPEDIGWTFDLQMFHAHFCNYRWMKLQKLYK